MASHTLGKHSATAPVEPNANVLSILTKEQTAPQYSLDVQGYVPSAEVCLSAAAWLSLC